MILVLKYIHKNEKFRKVKKLKQKTIRLFQKSSYYPGMVEVRLARNAIRNIDAYRQGVKTAAYSGFTLIELLIVIAIIGILASVVLVSLNEARLKARDAKRKTQIQSIKTALQVYYSAHGVFPPAGGCAYGTNCYVYSTNSQPWIPALGTELGVTSLPVDPVNSGGTPWGASGLTFAYGNVSADGQWYDLTAHLESTSDPDRCAVKHYKWYFNDVNNWCGNYSGQIYEVSSPP